MVTEIRSGGPKAFDGRDRGTVLVIVLITLMFASLAVVEFMDKADNDLAVVARATVGNRLRGDAYSALEVTLATLADFVAADQGLRSVNEGWGRPLDWAGYSPPDGAAVDVAFEDESGKIPLIHAAPTELMNLFESPAWNLVQPDAQHLTDVLLSWMQKSYIPTTAFNPDYEQADYPYDPPLRSIRSFGELASIDYVKDLFFDQNGRPNQLWWQFHQDFSIFNYPKPDINGANRDVLTAAGQFDPDQQQNIAEYLAGSGQYAAMGPEWFQSSQALLPVAGGAGNPNAFATTISALRVLVTVHDGRSVFRLSVVVAPQGGATTVQTTATDSKTGASTASSGETSSATNVNGQAHSSSAPTSAQSAAAAAGNVNLQYPFTILEILENDEIPTPPPAPPAPPTS